jgi:radical SAM family uncharacterized protein/radical SAM-linked protein
VKVDGAGDVCYGAGVNHPYEKFLIDLEKPARYVGCEYGIIRKDPDAVRTRFCLAFPDTYELGMSHLGLKVLYEVLGERADLSCERAFAPWRDLEKILRERGLPLVSLESGLPLADFHVVGFSLQFELTFTTVLAMLDLGRIPLRAADRGEDAPLIIAGGPVAGHPEPMAPFLDLVLVGDAEHALPDLLEADADLREGGASRADRVRELAKRPGLYAPGLVDVSPDPATGRLVVGDGTPVVRRVWEPELDPLPDTGGGPVASLEAVFDRAAIEISRGCNQGCRFCQAGFMYRPMRERSVSGVLDALRRRSDQGGYDEVSLTALSTADYSALGPLLDGAARSLRPRNVSLSVSSLRAVGLDGKLLDDLRTGRAGSLTFAPEAGSQTLRDRINKRISEEGLLQTAREVAARGWTRIKLYFMVGLPGEVDSDVDAIMDLADQVRWSAKGSAHKRPPKITAAVNNFVPKPHTPMQWSTMPPAEVLKEKQRRLGRHPQGRRVALRLHDVEMSLLEGRLARGDRRLADVIEHAYVHGARFDGWEDQFQPALWHEAFDAVGLDPATYLAEIPDTARLPWDHIDVGLAPGFLATERQRMERGKPGPACGVPGTEATQGMACLQCGLPCLDQPPHRALPVPALEVQTTPEPDPESKPAAQVEIEPRRLRLAFAKEEAAAYLGHLDLVRHLPRILRRAGLHPLYSRGFNPRPKLQFTPPLSVGIDGHSELCDAWITPGDGDLGDTEALLRRLEAATLPGLRFHAARWLDVGEPNLSKICHGAIYATRLPAGMDVEETRQKITTLLARPNWEVTRKSRRRQNTRQVDLRPSLLDMELHPDPDDPHRATLRFSLTGRPEGTLKPREILTALLGDAVSPPLRREVHFSLKNGDKTLLAP